MSNQPDFMLGISEPLNNSNRNNNKNKLYKTYIVIFNTNKNILLDSNSLILLKRAKKR